MLQPFGNHPEREGLHAGNCFVAVSPVGQDAGQGGYFSEPPAVVFALDLDGEGHVGNVPSGWLSNKPLQPTSSARRSVTGALRGERAARG